ncbi:MAG: DNA-directed RNA polymerase [Candidatus Woesearchaeota archaeon]|jgi:DNA-directed RNA polymerase subunit E'
MFYKTKVSDHIRVSADLLELEKEARVISEIKKKYGSFIDKDIGIVIEVLVVEKIGQGKIIAGDGAVYYESQFELLTFKPENQEVISGKIRDITDFGAFITMGPIDGMIHVSQTMNDFVSFSKEKALMGRDSKRGLKVGDLCRARVIAVSFKDAANPKIGLTMRQDYLGKPEWWENVKKEAAAAPVKETKKAKEK